MNETSYKNEVTKMMKTLLDRNDHFLKTVRAPEQQPVSERIRESKTPWQNSQDRQAGSNE